MGNRYKQTRGFTIIEVMLFLAVSGSLAVAILASSGVAISTQRYRDALNSLQSTLQVQYNQTSHVLNDRAGTAERCSAGGVIQAQANSEPRGSSDCLIMGRYIAISGGQAIQLSNIVGFKKSNTVEAKTDIEALRNYDYFVDSSITETSEVAWGGTVVVKDLQNNNVNVVPSQAFIIVIMRSPLTGAIRTFNYVGTKDATSISGSAINATNQSARKLCIDPASFTVGTKLGVLLREKASSAGAVELLTGDTGC